MLCWALSSFSVMVDVDGDRENGLRVPKCVSFNSAELLAKMCLCHRSVLRQWT